MAKLSGLIEKGKVGKADQKVVDAMPDAPPVAMLESSAVPETAARDAVLESSAGDAVHEHSRMLDSSAPSSATVELPVEMLRPSPYQVRAVSDNEYIETLMESVIQSGIISPIVVRPLESSVYEVIAGHHRLEACRRLGYQKIPVVVHNMNDSEAACALASDNFVRKELSDYERYKHARMLRDLSFCKTNSEIGQVLGVSRQLVGFLFAFDDYPAGAKSILEVNPRILGATQANELRVIAKDEPGVFTEAIELLAEGKLLQNQIKHWVESRFKSSPVRMQRRQEVKIQKPGLRSQVKLTYTDREAKIQAEGLNIDKLRKLLEDNLDSLLSA